MRLELIERVINKIIKCLKRRALFAKNLQFIYDLFGLIKFEENTNRETLKIFQ